MSVCPVHHTGKNKVYLAHNFDARQFLREDVVPEMKRRGLEVTSRWIVDERCTQSGKMGALIDLEDVDSCNTIIFFVDQFGPTPGRSKYFELGYAYAAGKRCILVGVNNTDCIFYHLPRVEKFATYSDAARAIANS